MNREKLTPFDITVFLAMVLLFIYFGQGVGWRAVGVLQLAFSIKIIKERRVGLGWEGFEPSKYITGMPAVILGILSIGIAIMLLFYPEHTVMKWNSK